MAVDGPAIHSHLRRLLDARGSPMPPQLELQDARRLSSRCHGTSDEWRLALSKPASLPPLGLTSSGCSIRCRRGQLACPVQVPPDTGPTTCTIFFFFRSFLALSRRASDLPRTPQDADKLNRHFRALSRRKTSSTDTFPRASEIKTRNLQASKAPTHFWIRTLRAYTLACVSPLENSS